MPVLNRCSSATPDNESPKPAPSKKHPIRVLELVGDTFGTSAPVLVSQDRHISIVKARFGAMWVLRQLGLSYPEIGRVLERDHTSVMHGVKKAMNLIVKDVEYERLLNWVLEEVQK